MTISVNNGLKPFDLTIPEPGGILLLGSGALTAIGAMRRRLQK
jgi:PEP-CTERM motif